MGASAAVSSSFGTMRFIVSVGWSIYPLGYFFGYLLGAVSEAPLNLLYNLADFVNKIWFPCNLGSRQAGDFGKERQGVAGGRQDDGGVKDCRTFLAGLWPSIFIQAFKDPIW